MLSKKALEFNLNTTPYGKSSYFSVFILQNILVIEMATLN